MVSILLIKKESLKKWIKVGHLDQLALLQLFTPLSGASAGPQGAEVGGNAGEGGVAEQEVERGGGAPRLAGGHTRSLHPREAGLLPAQVWSEELSKEGRRVN